MPDPAVAAIATESPMGVAEAEAYVTRARSYGITDDQILAVLRREGEPGLYLLLALHKLLKPRPIGTDHA